MIFSGPGPAPLGPAGPKSLVMSMWSVTDRETVVGVFSCLKAYSEGLTSWGCYLWAFSLIRSWIFPGAPKLGEVDPVAADGPRPWCWSAFGQRFRGG